MAMNDPTPYLPPTILAEQMREAAAALVENFIRVENRDPSARWVHADDIVISRADLAAAIRTLPLPEGALTPQEKLRWVRAARELLATARVAFVPRGAGFVVDEAPGRLGVLGEWWPSATRENLDAWDAATDGRITPHPSRQAARAWVLDTLRAEGWDVVEEGEGDG